MCDPWADARRKSAMGHANRGQLSRCKFSFLNEDLMARAKRKPILSTSPRTCLPLDEGNRNRERFIHRNGYMKKFLAASAVLVVIATPALAQTQISQHRAAAI